MNVERQKKLVTNFFKAEPKAQLLILTENNLTRDFVCHSPGGDLNRFGYQHLIEELAGAFPDIHYEINDMMVEGNEITVSWTMHGTQRDEYHGIPPTNKEVTLTGVTIERFRGDKIAENWEYFDPLSIEAQLKRQRISA